MYQLINFIILQEIVEALHSKCNIIPIIDNFQWPEAEELPEDMRAVCYFNGVRYAICHFFNDFITNIIILEDQLKYFCLLYDYFYHFLQMDS